MNPPTETQPTPTVADAEYQHPWDAIDAMIDAGMTIDAIMGLMN